MPPSIWLCGLGRSSLLTFSSLHNNCPRFSADGTGTWSCRHGLAERFGRVQANRETRRFLQFMNRHCTLDDVVFSTIERELCSKKINNKNPPTSLRWEHGLCFAWCPSPWARHGYSSISGFSCLAARSIEVYPSCKTIRIRNTHCRMMRAT